MVLVTGRRKNAIAFRAPTSSRSRGSGSSVFLGGLTYNSKKAHTVSVPRERALDELRVS